MLLKIFRGTGPGVIILIIITLSAVWGGAVTKAYIPEPAIFETSPMPLYGFIKYIIGNNNLLGVLLSVSLVGILSFILISFNTSILFINERTFLPAVIYILFTGFFPQCQVLNPVLPASVFLILAIRRIMDGYRKPGIGYNFFDAAFLISTGSLFYANLIWFGLLVIVGLVILRSGNLTEILVSVLGLGAPYLVAFGIYYILGYDHENFLSLITNNLFGESNSFYFSRITIVALIITLVIILIAVFFLFRVLSTKKIRSGKTFTLLLWLFLFSFLTYIILPSVSVEIVWIMAIPASYFLAHYFVFMKKKVAPEIIFALLFLVILSMQIVNLLK